MLGSRSVGLEGFVDRIQMGPDLIQQALSFQGQGHTACLPDQQRLAQAFFELAHLMAERTDRQVHRCGGAGQVAQSCGSDKALQGMQRWAGHKP